MKVGIFLAMMLVLFESITFTPACADITIKSDGAWPQVQITQGPNVQDIGGCDFYKYVYNNSMMLNETKAFPGTGIKGDMLCWRRSVDILHPAKGLTNWARCNNDDKPCEIQ
jgi:hypothetical protein